MIMVQQNVFKKWTVIGFRSMDEGLFSKTDIMVILFYLWSIAFTFDNKQILKMKTSRKFWLHEKFDKKIFS